jgi:hypothetical protein
MKKITSTIVATLLFGILFLSSCVKEDEPLPTDENGSSSKFVGSWRISENSSVYGSSTYYLSVTDSSNTSYIELAYLYGYKNKAYATKSGSKFTIPIQLIEGNYLSGNGVLTNANRIDLTYLVQTTTTDYDTVKAVLTK